MTLFEDPEFPPCDASLYKNPRNAPAAPNYVPGVKWLRIHQLSKSPMVFPDGVPPQVVQGALGDCWFLSALSVIGNRPLILQKIFEDNPTGFNINPDGKYTISFYYDQEWVDITVDDRFPCTADGSLAFSRAKNPNAFWVPIIEKAYAKLHGCCYENLEGGLSSQGLANLCGGIGTKIYFEDRLAALCQSEEMSRMLSSGDLGLLDANNPQHQQLFSTYLWKQFSIYSAFRALFCTGKSDEESGVEEATDDGLLQNHAYGILKFLDVGGHKLVQMRNPWGKVEWNGKWSDRSDAWTPEMKKACGWTLDEDGIFFISWEDFQKEFPAIFVQQLQFDEDNYDDIVELEDKNPVVKEFLAKRGGAKAYLAAGPPPCVRHSVALVGDVSGGCMNYATWRNCPQVVVKGPPNKPLWLLVQVCQKDMRYTGKSDYDEAIGFMVLRGPAHTRGKDPRSCGRLVQLKSKDDIIFKSKIEYSRFLTTNVGLPPYDGVYYIVGYMFHPTDETDIFNINVIPQTTKRNDTTIIPVARDYVYRVDDEFAGPRAGGCPNFETWVNNPQYVIKPLFGKANVTCLIIPGSSHIPLSKLQAQSMAICVFPDKKKLNKVSQWGETVTPMPDYAISNQMTTNMVLEGEQFIMMPQSFKPGTEFPYELFIYSTSPLKLGNVRKWSELFTSHESKKRFGATTNLMRFSTALLAKSGSVGELGRYLKRFFKDYDKSGNGTLERDEFRKALQDVSGGSVPEDDIKMIFDMIDEDSNGSIDYTEFANAVTNCCG